MAKTGFYQTNPVIEETESELSETVTGIMGQNDGKPKSSFYSQNQEYEEVQNGAGFLTAAEEAAAAAEAAQAAAEAAQAAAETAETNAETAQAAAEAALADFNDATFLELDDTPDSYSGQAGLAVVVKATEDGLEFTAIESGGL